MGYIRVRDFAEENGCTAQNIYKHLRKYTKQLEGHVVLGPGKQGQLLDDEAQAFLRSVMYPKSVVMDNDAMAAEMAEMRAAMMKLSQENLRLASLLATTEGQRDRALMDAGQYQKLLRASEEAEEARQTELSQAKEKAESEALRADQAESRAGEETKRADAAEAQIAALKGRGLWARITRQGE